MLCIPRLSTAVYMLSTACQLFICMCMWHPLFSSCVLCILPCLISMHIMSLCLRMHVCYTVSVYVCIDFHAILLTGALFGLPYTLRPCCFLLGQLGLGPVVSVLAACAGPVSHTAARQSWTAIRPTHRQVLVTSLYALHLHGLLSLPVLCRNSLELPHIP